MIRAFQWDLARQVERLDWLLKQLPRYAAWGYDELYLHLEDAVDYPSLPGVGRRDVFTYRQLARLASAATRAGIKVVPIVNLLGHTQYLIKVPELRDLNELRADDGSPLERGQICPLHPRTLDIAEKLLRDIAPFCTAGKVHVGLDESFHLGKHPLSRAEIARIGLAEHFAGYVKRLHRLTGTHRLQMGMWADMLYFLPEAISLLPSGITAYEWYYHAFTRQPRVELFNFRAVDLATPLKLGGIKYYGCPMNGAFRHEPLPGFTDRMENIVAWWRHAQRTGAEGFLVTAWEPSRLALELTTAIDAAAACLWLEPEVKEPREMLARGFARAFGRGAGAVVDRLAEPEPGSTTPATRGEKRTAVAEAVRLSSDAKISRSGSRNAHAFRYGRKAANLALACDPYPFAGYPRWEINDHWDTVSRRESIDRYREEERHFAALVRRARDENVPPALRASVEFRHYLAVRDRCVREMAASFKAAPLAGARSHEGRQFRTAARAASTLQKAFASGLRAAKAMWNLTRNPRAISPNVVMVRADMARWKAFRRGEPVFGSRWQLCYRVWNFAPAAQVVGVEQRQPDGTWRILQSCHTIEFQTAAARPRGRVVREHAAPIECSGDAAQSPRLRIFIRGVGEVKIGAVEITNGRTAFAASGFAGARWRRLGQPAPRSGWPEMDWTRNTAEAELKFRLGPHIRTTLVPASRSP